MQRFGNAEAAIAALPDITRRAGRVISPQVPTKSDAEREIAALQRINGRMLFQDDPAYPPLLLLMEDAPAVIEVLGDTATLSKRSVALVGSRNASANGMTLAGRLAEDLARVGYVVTSGLARGIDAAAHSGALKTGSTVACVAGGLDRPYPPENAALQDRVAESGAVVAEAPLGTSPQARHFPRRNRLIAGLSLGVVVVEAALRSGSLITARIALEEGRELFAVPGSPLDARCQGANGLIRSGAHLTESMADIIANLPDHPKREGLSRDPMFAAIAAPQRLAEPEIALEVRAPVLQALLALLGPSPTSVDDLIRRCQFSAPEVRAALLDLELAGRVETLPGSRVALLMSGL
jgi:DNA processing protein